MHNQLDETPGRIKQAISRLLVKFKFIKKFPLDIAHINGLIPPLLPANFDISLPGGTAVLSILNVDMSVLQDENKLAGDILCNFSVSFNRSIIYNTHLTIQLTALPDYRSEVKSIAIKNPKVIAMDLISDKDSVLRNSKSLISGFLPEPFKSLFTSTFSLTESVFSGFGGNELVTYLTLYLSGNTEKIFAYHYQEIEAKILQLISADDFCYELDEEDFHEKLFADYGQQVIIDNGVINLMFVR